MACADEKVNGGLSENPIAALEAAQAMDVDEKPAAVAAAPADAAAEAPKEEKMDTDIKVGIPDPSADAANVKTEAGPEKAGAEAETKVEKKEEEAKPEAPKKKKVVNEDLLRAFRYFDKSGRSGAL